MDSCCFTHQSPRWGVRLEWSQHPVGPQGLSLHLTSQGYRRALGSCRQDSHVDPNSCPRASSCTDFSAWGHLSVWCWLSSSTSWHGGKDSQPREPPPCQARLKACPSLLFLMEPHKPKLTLLHYVKLHGSDLYLRSVGFD